MKFIYLSVVILEFLSMSNGDCSVERAKRASRDANEKLKFYIECPNAEEPMVAMPSDSTFTREETPLAKLLRSSKLKTPLIEKPFGLEKLRSADHLKNIPKLNLDDIPTLRKPLNDDIVESRLQGLDALPEKPLDLVNNPSIFRSHALKPAPELFKPKIDSFKRFRNPLINEFRHVPPQPQMNLENKALDKPEQIQNNFKNALDNSQPEGRFTNILKDFIVSRKKQDLNPSSSDIVANEEPDLNDEDMLGSQDAPQTLADKIKALAEQKRKALDEAISSARSKLSELRNKGDAESESSNNLVAQALPEDNRLTDVQERARALRDKLFERFQTQNEINPPLLDRIKSRQSESNINTFPRETEKAVNRFETLAEKTRNLARKLKKLVDFDNEEEKSIIKSMAEPTNQRVNVVPDDLFRRESGVDKPQLLTDKLRNLMSQNPRISNSPLSKRQKIDDSNLSPSDSEPNMLPDHLSSSKSAMAERVQVIANKIRNAFKQSAPNDLRSADQDSNVDNSNIEPVVEDAPEDMNEEGSETIVKEAASDDVIDLTADSSKSANICKCIRVAFPEKFENGHFVMQSQDSEDTVSSASENQSNRLILPEIPKIQASSPLGSKLKRVFNGRNSDLSAMADEPRAVVAAAPDAFRTELSDVDKAVMADQGIRSLLEFVKIVDQVDQYITTKARKAISRLATVLTEDEDARIL